MNESLTIVHVIDGLGSGGAEALLVTNLRQFRLEGRFRHQVVTVFEENSAVYSSPHFWRSELESLGIEVVELRCRSKAHLGLAVVQLAARLRALSEAVVHTHLLWGGLVGRMAATLARRPVVSSVHLLAYEREVLAAYARPTSPKHQLARMAEMLSLRQADHLIAVGETVRDSTVRNLSVSPEKIEVIYNPVDFSLLDRTPTPRAQLIQELGGEGSTCKFLLLNVARVTAQKSQLELVREFALATKHIANSHLIILGGLQDTPYVERVRSDIRQLGLEKNVHLLGPRRDVSSWLAACDVFVFPSAYEGLPVALIEALCSGCVCVASDIGPHRELIVDDENGTLVGMQNQSELSRALVALFSQPDRRETMRLMARTRARRLFGVERSAQQLARIYLKVAG